MLSVTIHFAQVLLRLSIVTSQEVVLSTAAVRLADGGCIDDLSVVKPAVDKAVEIVDSY